jgi:surface antigen
MLESPQFDFGIQIIIQGEFLMRKLSKITKYFFILTFAILCVFQSRSFAVDNCGGIYSPKNPFPCTAPNGIQGNCVWWTWHWLRYGKGDRNVESSNSFRGDANTWDNKAISLGYTVITSPQKDTIAVNETAAGGLGHVATVDEVTSTGVWVNEMNWGISGFRRNFYSNGFFTKFIVPYPQPKLFSLSPNPVVLPYDAYYTISGENLDRVLSVEITFPGGGKGILYGSGQIPMKNYYQVQIYATLGTSGSYLFNVVTDQNIEAVPQMPVTVQ